MVENKNKNNVIQPKPAQPVAEEAKEDDEADLLNEMMALWSQRGDTGMYTTLESSTR